MGPHKTPCFKKINLLLHTHTTRRPERTGQGELEPRLLCIFMQSTMQEHLPFFVQLTHSAQTGSRRGR